MGRSSWVFAWTFIVSMFFIVLTAPSGKPGAAIIPGQSPFAPVRPLFRQHVMDIRFLVVKHCTERMADEDAEKAIRGIEAAKSRGLPIKVIGNEVATTIDKFREVMQRHMKNQATPGDVLMIHTIGHGGQEGGLMYLGQRRGVMDVLARASEETQQKTFWWQLSCYACAGLPKISDLTPQQQQLFAMYASSNASEPSPTDRQAFIISKVMNALAERNPALDPNGDYIITASELKSYINSLSQNRWGDRVFAREDDEAIFGQIIPLPAMVRLSLDRFLRTNWSNSHCPLGSR